MLRAVVGHSDDVDDEDAARDVIDACGAELGGASPVAALVFAGSSKDPSVLLRALAARHPGLPVIGTTGMAELSSSIAHGESSFALMMLVSDSVAVSVGWCANAAADPRGAARKAVEMARERLGTEPRLCIAFSDTMRVNISYVTEGLVAALGVDVPVVGGAAGCEITDVLDTREMCGAEVLREAVVVMLLGGRLGFSFGMDRGWTPTGTPHVATKTKDNLLLEIDGNPALALYERYLGAPGATGSAFVHHPLAVYEVPGGDFYLRAAFAQGPVPGSLITAGNIPEGATVRLTEYARENVIEAAALAAKDAKRLWSGRGDPAAALVFTCSTRKTILGTWTAREVEALKATLPASTPIAGFYAFSELAPFAAGKPSRVHNGSFVTLLLGEA